jgi:peptidyl-prolyl cis-trans isomerase D
MLRTMRANAKWVFYILAVSFIGWLAIGQVMSILGPSGNVVLRVNRKEYSVTDYQQRVQLASEQYRQQYGTAPLTKEEDRQLQDQVINQMIQDALLEQEYRRLGIRVSDEEIVAMAHNSPLPEIMRDPQFQTDGQFDIRKWQQFLSTTSDRNLLLQLEGIYRQQIPRIKLFEYLASDVYIPDAKLWRLYKDQRDSVRVTALAVSPYTILDTTPISDAELQAYIAKHPDDFKRPAVAYVRFIAVPRLPNADDSAAARAHVTRVRSELARGARFEDVAKRESSDSGSGQRGGDLGWVRKSDTTTFVAPFMRAVRSLKPGELSAPVPTRFGYHLIRIDQAKGDSVKVRHILIPVALQGAHLDQVEARADTLERLAAERSDPTTLDTVARRMKLQVSPEYRVTENQGFTLGDYRIPDVSVWAFETPVGETSPVIDGEAGYYVFRLDSVTTAGAPPLAQIRAQVTDLVRVEKLKSVARHRADSLAALLRGVPDLAAAAAAHGLQVQRLGPFTRMRPPRDLTEALVVGTAFGLRVGERSGVVDGEGAYFILESLVRKFADSTAWLAQKEVQRTQLLQALQQARIQQYLEGVRAKAKVVDRRKDLFKSQTSADASTLLQ